MDCRQSSHPIKILINILRVACMHVRCVQDAKYTLLFSHGNAVDLGQMSSFFIGLGKKASYEYQIIHQLYQFRHKNYF